MQATSSTPNRRVCRRVSHQEVAAKAQARLERLADPTPRWPRGRADRELQGSHPARGRLLEHGLRRANLRMNNPIPELNLPSTVSGGFRRTLEKNAAGMCGVGKEQISTGMRCGIARFVAGGGACAEDRAEIRRAQHADGQDGPIWPSVQIRQSHGCDGRHRGVFAGGSEARRPSACRKLLKRTVRIQLLIRLRHRPNLRRRSEGYGAV